MEISGSFSLCPFLILFLLLLLLLLLLLFGLFVFVVLFDWWVGVAVVELFGFVTRNFAGEIIQLRDFGRIHQKRKEMRSVSAVNEVTGMKRVETWDPRPWPDYFRRRILESELSYGASEGGKLIKLPGMGNVNYRIVGYFN